MPSAVQPKTSAPTTAAPASSNQYSDLGFMPSAANTTSAPTPAPETWTQKAEDVMGTINKYNPVNIGNEALVGAGKQIAGMVPNAAELGVTAGNWAASTPVGKTIAKDVIQPVARKLGFTPQMAGEVQQGIQQGVTKSQQDFAPKGLPEQAGALAANVAEFAVPGMGEEAGAALLPRMATQAAETGALSAAQTGSWKQGAYGAALGAAMPLLEPVMAAASKPFGNMAKEAATFVASKLSGVPKAAINYAIENPEAVQASIKKMSENPELGAEKITQDAKDALDALKSARSDAYEANMAAVEKSVPEKALTTQGIKKSITQTLTDFNVPTKGTNLDFTKATLPKSYQNNLTELVQRVYDWDDTTPKGMNQLRKIISSYRVGGISPSGAAKSFDAIVTGLSSGLSDYISERAPEVGVMNKEYAAASQFIDQAKSALSLETKTPTTAARKLLNVFNPKSIVYRNVTEQLGAKASKDLMSDIAGLLMSKWTAEGLGSYLTTFLLGSEGMGGFESMIHNPYVIPGMAATAATSSPRIVGETATRVPMFAKAIAPIAKPLLKGAAKKAAVSVFGNQ